MNKIKLGQYVKPVKKGDLGRMVVAYFMVLGEYE